VTVSNEVSVLSRIMTDGILAAACPSRTVLDHVTSKWGVLLLVALSERSMRWGELRRVVEGISEKMLAQTLRTLVQDGLLWREVEPTTPPQVTYGLTEFGREVGEPLSELFDRITRRLSADDAGQRPTPAHSPSA
jgi:DNA-binding HxlR family transcriptional regulator